MVAIAAEKSSRLSGPSVSVPEQSAHLLRPYTEQTYRHTVETDDGEALVGIRPALIDTDHNGLPDHLVGEVREVRVITGRMPTTDERWQGLAVASLLRELRDCRHGRAPLRLVPGVDFEGPDAAA